MVKFWLVVFVRRSTCRGQVVVVGVVGEGVLEEGGEGM
jgi:hypothetical protein